MYETLAKTYTLDDENQAFLRHANPWALRGIIERLNEAADRGLWAEPDPAVMEQMAQVCLDVAILRTAGRSKQHCIRRSPIIDSAHTKSRG